MTAPAPSTQKSSLSKALLPVAAILLTVIGGLCFVKAKYGKPPASSEQMAGLHVGTVLPDFSLSLYQGKTVQASSLTGKVTLINFWATWCEACVVEMPSIVKLRKQFASHGFDVVAINLDENPASVLPQALKELGIDFPVYTDPQGKLGDLFDVHAIPLTVIMDQHRKVLYIDTGEQDWNAQEMRAQVERWLSG